MTERYIGRFIGITSNNYPLYGIRRSLFEQCCGKGFEGDECCKPPFESCKCGGSCGSCGGGGGSSESRCIAHCYDFSSCTEIHALVPGACSSSISPGSVDVYAPGCFSVELNPEQYRSGGYIDILRQYAWCMTSICFYANEQLGPPPISPFNVIPCKGGAKVLNPAVPPGESCLQYWERICAEAHGAGTPGYIDCVNRAVSVCRGRSRVRPVNFRPTGYGGFYEWFEDSFDNVDMPDPVTIAAVSDGSSSEPRNTVTVTLTANVNDYNPGACRILAVQTDGSGSKTITGVSIGQQDGQWLIIENFSPMDNIVISVESSSSAPANRFNNGLGFTPITITPGSIERFIYTSRINRWRRV